MAAASQLSVSTVPLGLSCSSLGSRSISGERLNIGKSMTQQPLVLRSSTVCRMQEEEKPSFSSSVKSVAIAAAAALLVSSPAFALDSASNILNKAKEDANSTFSQAQKTGKETVGETAQAPKDSAPPALSQLDPTAEESPEPFADKVIASADIAADTAPGTAQQQGKGTNAIEKAFSTPSRGLNE